MDAAGEVYLVDLDEQNAGSLSRLLAGAGISTRNFDDGRDFLAACGLLSPGCVVAGPTPAGAHGIDVIQGLKGRPRAFPVIVLASGGDVLQAVECMKAGAFDFIEQPCSGETLLRAVRRAMDTQRHAASRTASQGVNRRNFATLTPREARVLQGVLDGKTSKVIARECSISPRTVEVHRARIMMKLGARSISEVVRMALAADYVAEEPVIA